MADLSMLPAVPLVAFLVLVKEACLFLRVHAAVGDPNYWQNGDAYSGGAPKTRA